ERGWDTWDREQEHMVLLGECFGTVQIAIRVHWCRPMRKEEIASWDGGNSTWGGRARVFGTVPALEGRPIRPRWMYPFERYMKKLKGYVRNKAKPEGSIAEGYIAEEALTFSSHYFRDVTTKFNRPDHNVDPSLPTCQFQVFRSVCKSIGLRSVIRFDAQELNKVKWYVLHNSPEIDTYRSQFKSLFPNTDMKKEFPDWFGSRIRQRLVDNDKDLKVSTTSELFALACGPTWTPILINSCVVDGVREMYYGQLQEILEFKYLLFKVVLFRIKWFDIRNKGQVDVPPDIIIDGVDEDDDIIDDKDALPHDLVESNNEDLINVDDDGVDKMSTDVSRSHGGDGGGEDRPLHTMYPAVAWVALLTEAKANKSPIWAAGQRAG
nr:hypothetical protein [Tanacetum cinerariifolium]